ncbi:hypothetical protein JAAARDRAFT_454727 [Jaapia argillacea MUCL 33604]|uniref:PH domain-containing protein n=1 Tax=Jaapia argillacea MUCL 33604 TaxID=933084 RepID=A0A067Q7Y6_9AGAM|nr:hypothetical protein JAAARDRAFT_454727 [Jaapia argillacea MUCL 33604]
MASPYFVPPPITVTPALETTKKTDSHSHGRIFIGPMPEKVLSRTEIQTGKKKKRKKRWFGVTSTTSDGDDESVSDVIREHALTFFINHGGREEDWDESAEACAREEMLQKWKDSEWGKILRGRKESTTNQRWVGGSFEVGKFLGVDILDEGRQKSLRDSASSRMMSTSQVHLSEVVSVAQETFVTAPSQFQSHLASGPSSPDTLQTNPLNDTGVNDLLRPISGSSSTSPLLRPLRRDPIQVRSELALRPSIVPNTNLKALSDGDVNAIPSPVPSLLSPTSKKGKGKIVHYSDMSVNNADEAPVPPGEVLARTGSAVEDTSAGAAQAAFDVSSENRWGDVIMRDRMLVRVSYSKDESLNSNFDEYQNRTSRHLEYEDWGEFIVAWRKDRLEIYEDFHTPGKEWFIGHKHLAFIVPLNSPKTKLFLYSFVDLTFCIVCPPTPVRDESKSRWFLHGAKQGINIFVFKLKSRTRAVDWMWELWRHMGGQIPPHIEVHCPALETRMKIDISADDDVLDVVSRGNILELCTKTLGTLRDWEYVVMRPLADGSATLELAWRQETKLDWVWQEEDVHGRPRDWAVISGLALKQAGKPARLEIRLGHHFPTHIHLKDGTHLDEPPSIEGYLDRIKPNSQSKQATYLVIHNGNLFALQPAYAHPPSPPGLPPEGYNPDDASTLREAEVRRGAMQILEAIGVNDLRSIVAVRRASHIIPQPVHDTPNVRKAPGWEDEEGFWTQVDRSASDDEDEGGDEGMAKAPNKARVRMRRSFELLLRSGHVVRFEAHSPRVALEWIDRLRALVSYWKRRHSVDAREEMDIAQEGGVHRRLTPQVHPHGYNHISPPEEPRDSEAALPGIGSLYHWCLMRDCRSILKGGKLFVRKGLRGQFEYVLLILISGHIVQFHIGPRASLHHRRKKRTISLQDAYVCSGYFAAKSLPQGEFNPEAAPVARRYQDGLEAEDMEEDTLFIIWYHPHTIGFQDGSGADKLSKVPPLSKNRKAAVFRTRSKLERDSWCWALNCEIEKVIRANQGRESKVREAGNLIKT